MAKNSSRAELKPDTEELSTYFESAKSSQPFLTRDEVRSMLPSKKTKTHRLIFGQFSLREKHIDQASLAFGVIILVAIVLGVGLLSEQDDLPLKESGYSSLKPTSDFRIERTSFQRQQLLNQVSTSPQPVNAKVQLLYKSNAESQALNKWQYKETDRKIPTLKVSKAILESLGFEFKGKRVIYEANVDGRGYLNIRVSESSHALSLGDYLRKTGVRKTEFYPLFISDVKGKQRVKFRFGEEDTLKLTQEYFNQMVDDLVPIAIPTPGKEGEFMAIFWFESTEELFDLLVDEKESSPDAQESVEEKGQEVSEVSNPQLVIRRNPTFGALDISLVIPKSEHIRLDLISIDGEPIRNLMSRRFLEASTYEHSYDLSDLQEGIYLVVMTTDTNRISKRIIKQ